VHFRQNRRRRAPINRYCRHTLAGQMVWKPLPVIVYGFAIHPLSSSSSSSDPSNHRPNGRLSTVPELEGENEEDANPYVVALEVGDEVYAFEEYAGTAPRTGEDAADGVWYRGYVHHLHTLIHPC